MFNHPSIPIHYTPPCPPSIAAAAASAIKSHPTRTKATNQPLSSALPSNECSLEFLGPDLLLPWRPPPGSGRRVCRRHRCPWLRSSAASSAPAAPSARPCATATQASPSAGRTTSSSSPTASASPEIPHRPSPSSLYALLLPRFLSPSSHLRILTAGSSPLPPGSAGVRRPQRRLRRGLQQGASARARH